MKPSCEVCGTRENVARSRDLGIICGGCILWAVFEAHRLGGRIA